MNEPGWWHTIELAPGVVTPGCWDLRPTAASMPWPPGGLGGLRCLDIGTMDGFWAFELERRGAAEVVAIDLPRGGEGRRPDRFDEAARELGSDVRYRELDLYDLDPADVGQFDLVVMGYVLQMVPDPLRALEAVRRVCRGHLLLLDTVSLPLSLLPSPLARLDARRGHTEWFVFNRRGLSHAAELAGFEVEAATRVLRDTAGPAVKGRSWRHAIGILGRSAAVRARATT